MQRILLVFGATFVLLLAISLVFLASDGPSPDPTATESSAGGEPDQASMLENGEETPVEGPLSISDEFLAYFDRTNPATGQNYSEKEVGAIQYLFERLPLNDFVQSLLNPDEKEARNKRLYELATAIQSGQATEEQIQEYYEARDQELNDRLEVLGELADQDAADRQRLELEEMRRSMYAIRDGHLKQARTRRQP